MNKRKLLAAIRKAIHQKLKYRSTELRAYVIDPTWDDDYDAPADDALDLADLINFGQDWGDRKLEPNGRIDVYVYAKVRGEDWDELSENVEVRFDEHMNVTAVLTTVELMREGGHDVG